MPAVFRAALIAVGLLLLVIRRRSSKVMVGFGVKRRVRVWDCGVVAPKEGVVDDGGEGVSVAVGGGRRRRRCLVVVAAVVVLVVGRGCWALGVFDLRRGGMF